MSVQPVGKMNTSIQNFPPTPDLITFYPTNESPVSYNPDYFLIIEKVLTTRNTTFLQKEAKDMLVNLLELLIASKQILNPLDPHKRNLFMQMKTIESNFVKYCEQNQILLDLYDQGIPLIFQDIKNEASNIVSNIVKEQQKRIIQTCIKHVNTEQLNATVFANLYAQCFAETQLMENVKNKILHLVEFAKIPENLRDFYKINFSHTGEEEYPFQIQVDNPLLGYSIYDLLHGSRIIKEENYDGATIFLLNKQDFEKLNEHLSDLIKWVDDFNNITGELLASSDGQYTALGQKALAEIWKNPIHLTTRVLQTLQTYNQDLPCLLFNHVSIFLKNHPERDFIKNKFLRLYHEESLVGANGKPKEFYENDLYRSTIGIAQLIKLCPRLNKLLMFKKIITNFTEQESFQAASQSIFEMCGNELEIMRQYKIQTIFDAMKALGLTSDMVKAPFNYLKTKLVEPQSLGLLEDKSLRVYEELLTNITGVCLSSTQDVYEFSPQEIDDLYKKNKWMIYQGQQRHKNISRLIQTLKSCWAYQKAIEDFPNIEEVIDSLKNEMIRRLNEYHRLSPTDRYYGKPMLDESIKHLELYIAKVVYQEKSRVNIDSIKKSLVQLAGILDQDLLKGCQSGFAGRIQSLLLELSSNTCNDLLDNIKQFQRNCLETAFQKLLGHSHESSMAIRDKVKAAEFLGLNKSFSSENFHELSNQVQRILKLFFQEYNPLTIYHTARSFFSDKFWKLNCENNDAGIYQLFKDLRFEGCDNQAEMDRKYRVNGNPENRWQYAFIQQDLPKYLASYLKEHDFLFVKKIQTPELYFKRKGRKGEDKEYCSTFNRTKCAHRNYSRTQTVQPHGYGNIGFYTQSSLPQHLPDTS